MAAVVGTIEDQSNDSSNNNTDSVKRRSRSRKPRGNRRNTIAGIDQKEIEGMEKAVNGFVTIYLTKFVKEWTFLNTISNHPLKNIKLVVSRVQGICIS